MPTIVDLRSDTVTRPSREMLAAMTAAELGDDVLGDDPTVQALEQRIGALTGKPAAVLTPSGTMANQLAIRSVCEPGDEVICDDTTHCHNYETGGLAALSGCSIRTISTPRGIFTPADVERLCRPPGIHFARSRVVVMENTNNRGSGSVWPLKQMRAVSDAAHALGLHVHLDGARLWNASVASGVAIRDYAATADTVSMCFSKGLGAPVGSILAGPLDLIERARRFRKMFGGAMRQAGLLAAAALYALEHHVERLAEDHANAKRLAEGIRGVAGLTVDPDAVETNIVIFDVDPARLSGADLQQRLESLGVRMLAFAPQRVRAVTHRDVSRADVDCAIDTLGSVLA